MRRQITPRQLSERLQSIIPKKILFSSEDQDGIHTGSPIWFSVVFDTIGVFGDTPSIISFGNESANMYLERISLIEIDEGASVLGDDLFVYCEDIGGIKCYTFLLANN